jgi:hypothetical protein
MEGAVGGKYSSFFKGPRNPYRGGRRAKFDDALAEEIRWVCTWLTIEEAARLYHSTERTIRAVVNRSGAYRGN